MWTSGKVILLSWQWFLSFIEQQRDVTLWNKLHGGDIMVMSGCHMSMCVYNCLCVCVSWGLANGNFLSLCVSKKVEPGPDD